MAYRYQQGIAWNIKSHQLRAWDIGYDAAQFGATAQDVSDASPGYFVTRTTWTPSSVALSLNKSPLQVRASYHTV